MPITIRHMRPVLSPDPRYKAACPTCGHLSTHVFFDDADAVAKAHRHKHSTSGPFVFSDRTYDEAHEAYVWKAR